jgi:hypothetical protein
MSILALARPSTRRPPAPYIAVHKPVLLVKIFVIARSCIRLTFMVVFNDHLDYERALSCGAGHILETE